MPGSMRLSGKSSASWRPACLAESSRSNGSWNCTAAPAILSVCPMRWRIWVMPWLPSSSGNEPRRLSNSFSTASLIAIRQSASSTACSLRWGCWRLVRWYPRSFCRPNLPSHLLPGCALKENPLRKWKPSRQWRLASQCLTKRHKDSLRSRSLTSTCLPATASRRKPLGCLRPSCAARRVTRRHSKNCWTSFWVRATTGAPPNLPHSWQRSTAKRETSGVRNDLEMGPALPNGAVGGRQKNQPGRGRGDGRGPKNPPAPRGGIFPSPEFPAEPVPTSPAEQARPEPLEVNDAPVEAEMQEVDLSDEWATLLEESRQGETTVEAPAAQPPDRSRPPEEPAGAESPMSAAPQTGSPGE